MHTESHDAYSCKTHYSAWKERKTDRQAWTMDMDMDMGMDMGMDMDMDMDMDLL